MSDPGGMTFECLVREVGFHALRVNDGRLNSAADELLARFGVPAVGELVRVATNRKNTRAHRLRALAVISRIGRVPDLDDMSRLFTLLRDRNHEIQEAVRRLFGLHRWPVPGGCLDHAAVAGGHGGPAPGNSRSRERAFGRHPGGPGPAPPASIPCIRPVVDDRPMPAPEGSRP